MATALTVWVISSLAGALAVDHGAVLEGMGLAALGGVAFGIVAARRFDGVTVRVRRRRSAIGEPPSPDPQGGAEPEASR